jgi:hypothetical protein
MAIAEIVKIMATTMSNSISEKPLWFFMNTPKITAQCGSAPGWTGAALPPNAKTLSLLFVCFQVN